MLNQHYFFYVWKVASAGLTSMPGMVSILLLVAALATLFLLSSGSRLRTPGFWLLLLGAIAAFTLAFRGATYSFVEDPDSLDIPALAGEPDCGTVWSAWIRSGYGMGNPCPVGCYRGKIVNKQLRMRGLPPWPEYRREMQCWARESD